MPFNQGVESVTKHSVHTWMFPWRRASAILFAPTSLSHLRWRLCLSQCWDWCRWKEPPSSLSLSRYCAALLDKPTLGHTCFTNAYIQQKSTGFVGTIVSHVMSVSKGQEYLSFTIAYDLQKSNAGIGDADSVCVLKSSTTWMVVLGKASIE